MKQITVYLPHVNASLNLLATVLLVIGYVLIKQRRELAHKRVMLTCFGVSVAFLICYLLNHYAMLQLTGDASKHFPDYPPASIRYAYLLMLLTHVVLAAAVPVLAIITIYHGLRDNRAKHVRLARWTFPIWLYVSVTGVLVYLALYWVFPPQ